MAYVHTSFSLSSYLNAIQTSCPHILRYLTAAIITNKRRPTLLRDLVKVIRQVNTAGEGGGIMCFVVSQKPYIGQGHVMNVVEFRYNVVEFILVTQHL